MCLSECSNCKYAIQQLHHLTDIGCALAPAYWEMWNRLKDLSASSIGCMPIEPCREFEELEEIKQMTLSITLTRQQWQALAVSPNAPEEFAQQVFSHPSLEPLTNSISVELVSSSNIRAIGYNRRQSILQVNFHSGHGYQYFNVPQPIFEEFLQAYSKGRFFNSQIKNHYRYQQIF